MLPGNVGKGISFTFIVVPIIAEIIDSVKLRVGVHEDDEESTAKISDLAAGLFGACNAIGSFSAPIIGGILCENYGFRSTCDIIAAVSLTYGFIYLAANTIPYIIASKKNKSNE